MRHRLLIQQGALSPALQARLQEKYETQQLPGPGAERDAFLAANGKGWEAIATNAGYGCDAQLASSLPDLRVVSSLGVGLDKFDLPALTERGIVVGYTPEVLNDAVADLAFALLLALSRRIVAADGFVRRGDWPSKQFPIATQVAGKKLGILGLGRIGSVVARRASGFDMEVRYHNRSPVADSPFVHERRVAQMVPVRSSSTARREAASTDTWAQDFHRRDCRGALRDGGRPVSCHAPPAASGRAEMHDGELWQIIQKDLHLPGLEPPGLAFTSAYWPQGLTPRLATLGRRNTPPGYRLRAEPSPHASLRSGSRCGETAPHCRAA